MNQETEQAINYLKTGKVIIYPTDTIWGLGCDPFNQEAVDRIFEIKKRPPSLPLIVIVDSIEMLKTFVPRLHPHLEDILYYNIRPLTIIHEGIKNNFARGVTAADGSLAIRIVRDEFCQKIIRGFGGPVISTSANIHHQPFPRSRKEIDPDIIKMVDYIYCPPEYSENDAEIEPSLIARYCQERKELIFLRS